MNSWNVKRGNTSIQDVETRDRDNKLIENLADATSIKFQVKKEKTSTAIIEKTKDSGIAVNVPRLGFLRITLLPADTAIEEMVYLMALEIEWSEIERYETRIYINNQETNRFTIENHIIQ